MLSLRHLPLSELSILALAAGFAMPAVAQAAAGATPDAVTPDSAVERLVRSLGSIRMLEQPGQRASLLLDLVEACAPSACPEPPAQLLSEAALAAAAVHEPAARAGHLLRSARLHHRLGFPQQAAAALEAAREAAEEVAAEDHAAVMLQLSLVYGDLNREDDAAGVLASAVRKQPKKADVTTADETTADETTAAFPFTPELTVVDLGFAVSGASYLDTTALVSVNLDLYSQAERSDLDVDLMAAADYDSTRTINNVRPHSQAVLVWRHHLNERWNLFFDQLLSVNSDTFSSDDNDEDLSVLSASFVGAGLNLWRGEDPSSFVEIQLGAGVRYEYEYVDFRLRRNEAYPAPLVALRTRELPVGSGRFNQTLAVSNSMYDWENFFVWSSSQLKIPLGDNKKWWWSNELVLRYRNLPVTERAPNVTALFSTGLTYSF